MSYVKVETKPNRFRVRMIHDYGPLCGGPYNIIVISLKTEEEALMWLDQVVSNSGNPTVYLEDGE